MYTLFTAPPLPPRQVVQKVDNAIIWINLYSVDNIIGFPNTYCWIVIYAMVSAIQHLNNWVQGITVVSRETEDSVCLCKVLGDKQGGDFFKIGITVLGILGVCVPPGFPNPDPISDQKKCHFSHPFSDLASEKLCHHYQCDYFD